MPMDLYGFETAQLNISFVKLGREHLFKNIKFTTQELANMKDICLFDMMRGKYGGRVEAGFSAAVNCQH